jgi:uncharacterized protein YdhG (YjbR/CyaY superfamily)
MKTYQNVEDYIAQASLKARPKLIRFRSIIKELAPQAEESISYGMPAYKLNGPLVYFGAFKDHVSLFATASQGVKDKFAKELNKFKTSKGTIQFPLDSSLPVELIKNIVKLRVEENEAKSKLESI